MHSYIILPVRAFNGLYSLFFERDGTLLFLLGVTPCYLQAFPPIENFIYSPEKVAKVPRLFNVDTLKKLDSILKSLTQPIPFYFVINVFHQQYLLIKLIYITPQRCASILTYGYMLSMNSNCPLQTIKWVVKCLHSWDKNLMDSNFKHVN